MKLVDWRNAFWVIIFVYIYVCEVNTCLQCFSNLQKPVQVFGLVVSLQCQHNGSNGEQGTAADCPQSAVWYPQPWWDCEYNCNLYLFLVISLRIVKYVRNAKYVTLIRVEYFTVFFKFTRQRCSEYSSELVLQDTLKLVFSLWLALGLICQPACWGSGNQCVPDS